MVPQVWNFDPYIIHVIPDHHKWTSPVAPSNTTKKVHPPHRAPDSEAFQSRTLLGIWDFQKTGTKQEHHQANAYLKSQKLSHSKQLWTWLPCLLQFFALTLKLRWWLGWWTYYATSSWLDMHILNLLYPLSLHFYHFHILIIAICYPPPAFMTKGACIVTFRNPLGEWNSKQDLGIRA